MAHPLLRRSSGLLNFFIVYVRISLMGKIENNIDMWRREDVRKLALSITEFSADERMHILRQVAGWQKAIKKIPSLASERRLIYPSGLAMEQCSSEQTAIYKSQVVGRLISDIPEKERCLVDITGGFGVDFFYICPLFNYALYIERDSELFKTTSENFKSLGLTHVETINNDSVAWLAEKNRDGLFSCFYVDPSRRSGSGERAYLISDCEPDLTIILNEILNRLDKRGVVIVKLSPMLDISMAISSLTGVIEVHVVSVRNECKELLLVIGLEKVDEIPYYAVNITPSRTDIVRFSSRSETQFAPVVSGSIGTYLYEPNSSIMKMGAFNTLSAKLGIARLHTESHLYSSDRLISDFPGKIFKIERVFGFSKRELRELSGFVKRANISVRNFPQTAEKLRLRLGLKDGGESHIHATTIDSSEKILILSKLVK